jgi:DNA-binding MarR family transcriptional regulator
LAYLLGASRAPSNASSIGTIAEWLGMDPTTLNRNLKPLVAKGLVRIAPDSADGRVRVVRITEKGQRALLKAVPHWRSAQAQVAKMLGPKATAELNELLDTSASSLRSVG